MVDNSLSQARKIGVSPAGKVYRDRIGGSDRTDDYQFQLSQRSYLAVTLRELSANADLLLFNAKGTLLQQSTYPGDSSEIILRPQTSKGTFFLRVVARQQHSTHYRLEVAAVPLSQLGSISTPPAQPTRLLANINPTAAASSNPSDFIEVSGVLYFAAEGIAGRELWQTNGTQAGTSLVSDINPGVNGSNPTQLTNVNNVLYFAADNGINGQELYRLNPTTKAAELVQNINTNGNSGSNPTDLINVNGTLYFTADDGIRGRELWRSDGTASGTRLVRDINIGTAGSISDLSIGSLVGATTTPVLESLDRSRLVNINNTLYFAANDGIFGTELWKSDGTTAGTQLVSNINGRFNTGSEPTNLVDLNGVLYFAANDGIFGTELWKSDGTTAGTQIVNNINSNGANGSSPSDLINVNGTLFFAADDGINGRELYQSNGTQVTRIDINFGTSGSISDPTDQGLSDPIRSRFASINGTLYFAATSGVGTGIELWRSSGTQAGTTLVRDINPGREDANPQELININGVLYFSADGGAFGRELWKSDGTVRGTVQVSDINAGTEGSDPAEFVLLGTTLIFSANTTSFGRELWSLPLNG